MRPNRAQCERPSPAALGVMEVTAIEANEAAMEAMAVEAALVRGWLRGWQAREPRAQRWLWWTSWRISRSWSVWWTPWWASKWTLWRISKWTSRGKLPPAQPQRLPFPWQWWIPWRVVRIPSSSSKFQLFYWLQRSPRVLQCQPITSQFLSQRRLT